MKNTKNLAFAERYAQMMISRIEEIDESNYTTPWFNIARKNFVPQNITGRMYHGGNHILLSMYLMYVRSGYKTPVFLTFLQARERGLCISKGEGSFPVYYCHFFVQHKTSRETIKFDDYRNLSPDEMQQYNCFPRYQFYNVFNIEQTDLPTVYPEKWDSIVKRFNGEVPQIDVERLISCPALDRMLADRSWDCPIDIRRSDKAFYVPASDCIVCPEKSQYSEAGGGESFYSVVLHEMSHSTGHKSRLNRKFGINGDSNYAREELVAELSAAITGYWLGISSVIRDENAAYLKSWLKSLKEKPDFLLNVLADVSKASTYILDRLGMDELFKDGEALLNPVQNRENAEDEETREAA